LFKQRGLSFEFLIDEGMIILQNAIDGVDKPIALIGNAEKGALTLDISVETEGGHSSQPPPISRYLLQHFNAL
jgi:carboxypeptidase PM20D1